MTGLPSIQSVIIDHYRSTGETEFTIIDRNDSPDDADQIAYLVRLGLIEVTDTWISGWRIKLLKL